MARQVKCKICEKLIDKGLAYCVTSEKAKKNTYYCTKEEFEALTRLRDEQNKIYILMAEVLGYEYLPPVFKSVMNDLYYRYSYEVVVETINECDFDYANHKEFNNDFVKSKYFKAILENSIEIVSRKMKQVKAAQQKDESSVVDLNYFVAEPSKPQAKQGGILEFLDEGDM